MRWFNSSYWQFTTSATNPAKCGIFYARLFTLERIKSPPKGFPDGRHEEEASKQEERDEEDCVLSEGKKHEEEWVGQLLRANQ